MRLPLIPPVELNAEQRPLYEDMKVGICEIQQLHNDARRRSDPGTVERMAA
jgi:hypothetical protein